MMVNFIYHLDWTIGCPDNWLNIISGCVCGVVSGRHSHLNWWTE